MKRKIIRQGHNTLTLTLPMNWAKKLNIKPGDEIDVYENESSLVINGHQNNKEHLAKIDITNFTIPLLWRYFQSAYRAGCTEIKIIYDPNKKEYEDAFHYYTTQFDYEELGEKVHPKSAIAMIHEVVNRFIGIEIIETGKGYCVIREMGEPSAKEFDNSLRRIFLIVQELFDRTIEAIENNEIRNVGLCKEIHTIDLNIDKFVDYCCRILNKISNVAPENKKQLLFSTLFILELVGDEFKYIAKHLALTKKPVKECLEEIREVRKHFDIYYSLFYKFDRETAIKFGENDISVYKKNRKAKPRTTGDSRSILRHFMMISKLTLALVELRVQMEF